MLSGIPPAKLQKYLWERALNEAKYEIAHDLGLLDKLREVGWGGMSAKECGRIGGNMGGKIGGEMVRRMIEMAERDLLRPS